MNKSEQQFRVAEIDVARNPTDEKIVGIFRFESIGSGKHGPILIILAEIHSTLYVYERLLDVLNQTAEQARVLIAGVSQDPVSRFEKLIQRLNESLLTFTESDPTPLSWNRINIFAIEFSEGHMCLAGIGHLMNMFLQKQTDGSFRSFDIFGSLEQPAQIDPKKPFASFICGDFAPGDIFIAGSSNLERLRTELGFKDRLTQSPPVTAALEIRQDLEKRGIPDHFIAAIVTLHEAKNAITEKKESDQKNFHSEPNQSTLSIEKLRQAEEEAAERLSPVINPIKPLNDNDTIKRVSNIFSSITDKITSVVKTKKRDLRRTSEAMSLQSLRGMNAGYGNILTKKRKVIIAITILFIAVITAGILWYKHSKKIAAEIATWNSGYDLSLDYVSKAESNLIYGNESQAKSDINNAEKGVKALITDTPERQTKIDTLKKEVENLKEKLKKIVKTENINEIFALPPTNAQNSLAAPIVSKNNVYIADNSSQTIIKIDLNSKEVKKIALPNTALNIVSATEGTTSILFANARGELFALKKSNDAIERMEWSHSKGSSTVDIILYASRLYSLDPSNNQIWRSQGAGNSFGSESGYIKAASTSLEDAVSLAIDSSVYILKKDGTLLRFMSGGQEGFSLAAIDPVLRAASAVWTDMDSQNIYLTDPADKRLLIFDKNGQLKAQIISTSFKSPKDVIINETAKQAFVLDGNRLLLVPLP